MLLANQSLLSCVLTNIYSNKVEVEAERSLEHKLINVIGTANQLHKEIALLSKTSIRQRLSKKLENEKKDLLDSFTFCPFS